MKKKKKPTFETETQLCEVLVQPLAEEGWEIFYEVETPQGTADIVARRDGFLWIIEAKLQYGSAVLEQAYRQLHLAHYVSVATPPVKQASVVGDYFARKMGIGHLEVRFPHHDYERKWAVDERISPVLLRRGRGAKNTAERLASFRWLSSQLTDHHKTLIPGAPNGGQLTQFKLTMKRIQDFLTKHGPATVEEILREVPHHYKTQAGAKAQVAKALGEFPEWRDFFERKQEGRLVRWDIKRG